MARVPAVCSHDGRRNTRLPRNVRRMIGGAVIKAVLGPRWTTWARTVTRGLERPSWGNLRRVTPLSTVYGFDRGTPIDRYYVDKFFSARRNRITGRVLEIQTRDHIRRYGSNVTAAETLDVNPSFKPTYCCDLANAAMVPKETGRAHV